MLKDIINSITTFGWIGLIVVLGLPLYALYETVRGYQQIPGEDDVHFSHALLSKVKSYSEHSVLYFRAQDSTKSFVIEDNLHDYFDSIYKHNPVFSKPDTFQIAYVLNGSNHLLGLQYKYHVFFDYQDYYASRTHEIVYGPQAAAIVISSMILVLPLLILWAVRIEERRRIKVRKAILELKSAREIAKDHYTMKARGMVLDIKYIGELVNYLSGNFSNKESHMKILIEIPSDIITNHYDKVVGRLDVERINGELFVRYIYKLPIIFNAKKMMKEVLRIIDEVQALE